MNRRSVAFITILVLALTFPASVLSAPATAGECGPVSSQLAGFYVDSNQSLAEVFTASVSGNLQSVELVLAEHNGPRDEPLDVEFAQYDAVTNTFTTLAATQILPGTVSSDIFSPTTVTVTFPATVSVQMGQQYGILLSSETPAPAQYLAYSADTSDVLPGAQGCPDDRFKYSAFDGPYVDYPFDEDLAFKVLVQQASTPTSAEDCKKGGWQQRTDDEGRPFKNQGDCVSFVSSGGTNKADG